jgi:hypothetical protein
MHGLQYDDDLLAATHFICKILAVLMADSLARIQNIRKLSE